MSPTRITLMVAQGSLKGKTYSFEEPTRCAIGRAEDCEVQLPMDLEHADISRHHCLLEIDPPSVRVRDLGSRNGTFVNGVMIGKRSRSQSPEEAARGNFMAQELKDGDEIRVGQMVFQVGVEAAGEISEPLYYPMAMA
jgi:pSer/pThr/pTyr-binding forkhead associated (FHA) protein